MIRDASPQAVFTYAAHPIVVYTGCSCPPLTNHFTACPLPVRYQSLHVPYHSLTSKTSYHKGQGTLLCVPWVNVWHVKKDKIIDVSVSTLCGKTEHILISCCFHWWDMNAHSSLLHAKTFFLFRCVSLNHNNWPFLYKVNMQYYVFSETLCSPNRYTIHICFSKI